MEQESVFDIEEELKKLPGQPGVYIMHDASDEIIYVGKAISLRNRVRQYFRKTDKTARIEKNGKLNRPFRIYSSRQRSRSTNIRM